MSSTSWRVPMPGRLLGRPIKRLYRAGAPIRLYPRPARNLRRTAFGWTATGTAPHLALDLPRRTAPPSGLVRLRYPLDVEHRARGLPPLHFGTSCRFSAARPVKLLPPNCHRPPLPTPVPAGPTQPTPPP